ncbi:radical SAM family heme chaperone HemW [Laribacter hongkongensis]|uniref:radical SAM family heme chaperone HemW n=1 Tax=Laribacter hongkongensis TaxID=168471 RepID=UPI001EFEC883|nr:radical SAM family heme chaperone HemW [Laribacter hongkongensis]MCG9097630.1 radical SAM family heme chaperone HemW [Laribacter hongkongensis]
MGPSLIATPQKAGELTVLPPLSLYVHVPWCLKKCPYCDFNSHGVRGPVDGAGYIDALLADLDQSLPLVWGRPLKTVFIGGGTPSLLSAEAFDRLLSGVRARLKLDPQAEITLEANPGTAEAGRFREYRAAGINRLSIGIQSFDDRFLHALGRVHDGKEAHLAADLAADTFNTFNLDLMYALPGQTLAEAQADVAAAVAHRPTHLSCYHLTLEPNTLFAAAPPAGLPDDDTSADMQEAIEARLAEAGFCHYETSAFARPGFESRHNLNYWTFGDYLGIGAGAHGKISFADRIVRQMKHKQPQAYLEAVARGQAVQNEHEIAVVDRPFEFMMNALRLTGGVPTPLFSERTGVPLARISRELAEAVRQGLLDTDPARLAPTPQGQRFLNDLLTLFLRDAGQAAPYATET